MDSTYKTMNYEGYKTEHREFVKNSADKFPLIKDLFKALDLLVEYQTEDQFRKTQIEQQRIAVLAEKARQKELYEQKKQANLAFALEKATLALNNRTLTRTDFLIALSEVLGNSTERAIKGWMFMIANGIIKEDVIYADFFCRTYTKIVFIDTPF